MKLVGLFLCSSVFLAVILNKVKCEEYLGCYKDGDDPERLLGHLRYFHDSLTPQVCITYCTGYAYAGLQDGNQCFCGDDEPNVSKKTEDKECDHRCTGDRSQICGGDWRDTVYKLTHAIKAAVGNIPFTYLGCYTDQANPRMLQGSFKDFGDYMTPLQCVNFCKDAGYHYAGLQYRTQCFCGDQTPKIEDKVSEKRCVARCSGDITSICGGNWKSTVYATGLTKVSTVGNIGYKYEGCFRDVEESRRLGGFKKDFGENLVPKDCIELCKSYGYHYAGLQFRIECFCGDELLRSDKRPDTECLEKCSGDVTQLCGAGFRNTVYNTGLSVKANIANIGYTYLGCYKDQADPRLLQGYFKDFGDYLSPLACVEFCKNLGYIHAGVEYRTQCFCGDQKLESKYKVPDTECKSRCGNEDINSICGGGWKASVYSTGLTQVAIVEDIGYKYEGCYRDNVDNRRLNAFEESFEDNLVPKKCLDLCKRNGYLFAGLQNRVECFCGDADLLPSDKIPDSECQHRCSGDITKICGGSSKNTVYSTGNTVKASIADIGFSYLGCYRDSSEKRRIQGDYKEFEEDLTPEICVNYCKKLDYKYAGMQYSKECYCGNDQPLIQDKIDDSECRARCSGDNTNYCGGNFRNTIYSTNLPGSLNGSNVPCEVSVTTVNGYKPTCKGEVVFFDNFSGTSISNKWSHVVQIANEWDSEFVVYKKEASTSYTNDGHLVIKPIVLSDSNITSGRILLSGCTGIVGTDQCEKQAKAYLILPPVESARLISRNSFSFRYGRVDIRAKLPKGDWLVPDILLESKGNTYGTDDSHSRIRISMSRGNQDLLLDEIDLSCKSLEVGIAIGEGRNTRRLTTVFKNPNECWHLQYHDFSLIWSNGNITFVVDGTQTSSTIKTEDGNFTNGAGLNKDVLDLWSGDTNSAAFDSDFYITLGVSVGGGINFPDNIINRGRNKPWMNSELKHTLNFWKDRKNWERTWSVDSALHVDYVKVTAL